MAKTNTNDTQKGVGLHARRIIAYVVLIIISFFCLFWFYIMFINATRSNGELQSGFTAIPSTNLLKTGTIWCTERFQSGMECLTV